MSTEETAKTGIWANMETMPSLNPVPGITLFPVSGDHLTIGLVRLEPGAVLPSHDHPHEQAGTVIDGILRLTIEGETRELTRGDIYLIPSHATHTAVAGAEGCLVIDVFSPPREDYRTTLG